MHLLRSEFYYPVSPLVTSKLPDSGWAIKVAYRPGYETHGSSYLAIRGVLNLYVGYIYLPWRD